MKKLKENGYLLGRGKLKLRVSDSVDEMAQGISEFRGVGTKKKVEFGG